MSNKKETWTGTLWKALVEADTDPMNSFCSYIQEELCSRYMETHRYYHYVDHIENMLVEILETYSLTLENKIAAILAIAFHDAIYDPTRTDNEERSADLFSKHFPNHPQRKRIHDLILSTKLFSSVPKGIEKDELFKLIRYLDTKALARCDYEKIIKSDKLIEKEYQCYPWVEYRDGRLDFINKLRELKDFNYVPACDFMEKNIKCRVPNIGVYAGSFDPFHIGHLDILYQAEEIFDKVIILVCCNPEKPDSVNSLNDRYKKVNKLLKFHQVDMLEPSAYVTDYIFNPNNLLTKKTLIRGLRTDTDFKREEVQLRIMQDLYCELQTVFLLCDKSKEHISSSMIRLMGNLGDGKDNERYLRTTQQIYNLHEGD